VKVFGGFEDSPASLVAVPLPAVVFTQPKAGGGVAEFYYVMPHINIMLSLRGGGGVSFVSHDPAQSWQR
jgi:hypothetical protein